MAKLEKIMEVVRAQRTASGVRGDPAERLMRLFEQDREANMVARAAANLDNTAELDAAYRRMEGSSKAMKFLRDRASAREARGTGEQDERPGYREVYRIKGIEYFRAYPAEDVELINEILIQAHARADTVMYPPHGLRFTDAQAQGLLAFDKLEGLFGPIGVGHGKTFITLLCAALAWERKVKRILLLVPPQVYSQLVSRDIPQARRDLVLFGLPFIGLGGETAARRRAIVTSGKNGCYIMPYSLTSTKDTSFMLDNIAPELIIADEAHCLKNLRHSSRAKRVAHYMRAHDPKFVAVSGTMTTKSILDYKHLLEWCLGPGSCLPLTEKLALEWAKLLDSETHSHGQSVDSPSVGPILKLVKWARDRVMAEPPEPDDEEAKNEYHAAIEALRSDKRGFRTAYRLRMESTPGVVSTPNAQIGTSLYFQNEEADAPSPDIVELMEAVDDWQTPQEEPIEFGLHKFKWFNELSAGFWHKLRWPTPEEYIAHRDGVSLEQAIDMLERADDHLQAQRVYHSELRKWLEKNHIPGIDTPMLVANHVSRCFGTSDLRVAPLTAALYMEMKKRDFEGRPKRLSEPVWVDDYKLRHAVKWAQQPDVRKRGGIVWYHHQTVGTELTRLLTEADLNPLHCPAGRAADKIIAGSAGRLAVASITAHNTGKNLQFHTRQHIVQWPRSAKDLEQVLGRLHRLGQRADELIVDTNLTTDFDHMNVNACLLDALYIHQTGGGMQKAVVAGWNPLPRIFPNSVLVERGLNPEGGEAMERAMRQHFGGQNKT